MDGVQRNRKAVRAVLGEEEGLLVDHLTKKNLVGIQALLLAKERERCTIVIALGMSLRMLNLLLLMAR